jgi:hypothetical protein
VLADAEVSRRHDRALLEVPRPLHVEGLRVVERLDRSPGRHQRGLVEGEADRHRVQGGSGRLVVKGSIPTIDPPHQDDVPVLRAEVPPVPWGTLKWADGAMAAEEVGRCGLGGLALVSQDDATAGAEGIQHGFSVAAGDTTRHGALPFLA